jgi:hypothetical protein
METSPSRAKIPKAEDKLSLEEQRELLSVWAEEAERRAQAMEDGSEPEIPAEEVFARVRASLC